MTQELTIYDQFRHQLNSNAKRYGALLRAPDDERNRYMAEVIEAVSVNPKLMDAHRKSLLQAIGLAAAQGFSILPILGEAYLIPRSRNIGTKDRPEWVQWVNFQPGYKGLVKLAHRSGLIDSIGAEVAYDGEVYKHYGGTSPRIDHEPDDRYRTRKFDNMVAAYAVSYLKGSSHATFAVVARQELTDVRNGTKTKWKEFTDVWRDHPEAQAKKTALIRLSKVMPREDKFRQFILMSERANAIAGGKFPSPGAEIEELEVGDEDPTPQSLGERMRSQSEGDGEARPEAPIDADFEERPR